MHRTSYDAFFLYVMVNFFMTPQCRYYQFTSRQNISNKCLKHNIVRELSIGNRSVDEKIFPTESRYLVESLVQMSCF